MCPGHSASASESAAGITQGLLDWPDLSSRSAVDTAPWPGQQPCPAVLSNTGCSAHRSDPFLQNSMAGPRGHEEILGPFQSLEN